MANAPLTTGRKLRAQLEESLWEAAAALERRHKELGQRIAAARKAKQWKQKELAAAVHVEPTTVSRWETGTNAPDLTMLGQIAEALAVPLRELVPDVPLQQSEIAELRDEVRELRDAFVEVVSRIDRLLGERDRPLPGKLFRPERFGEA